MYQQEQNELFRQHPQREPINDIDWMYRAPDGDHGAWFATRPNDHLDQALHSTENLNPPTATAGTAHRDRAGGPSGRDAVCGNFITTRGEVLRTPGSFHASQGFGVPQPLGFGYPHVSRKNPHRRRQSEGLELLEAYLDGAGYEIDTAHDGETRCAKCRPLRPTSSCST